MGHVILSGVSKGMTVPKGFPPIGTALNDMTWEDIRKISDAGLASTYFNVCDRKAVVLKGTVGSLSLDGTYYCYIIGIDHNSEIEGTNRIHFQFAKTSEGDEIAFCDNYYSSTDSTKAFRMNTTKSKVGGWESSYMRSTICEEFLNILPTDLQNVILPCTKYSDNTGDGSDNANYVTQTSDKIFLLSEFEVQGKRQNANSSEQNYQNQYDYYKSGNSKIRYRHDDKTTCVWWTRSLWVRNEGFCGVAVDGGLSSAPFPNGSYGFAPCFCV